MSTWSGKTLGKVLIGDLIARGGMAEVYEGLHTTLQRKVAVKIMRDHVDEDPETRTRFEREARVVANLHHPNIIQIFDYDLADGRPCLVMELVPGASLGNYLKALQKREEKLPFDTIARLLTSIASAVDYAHEQNIVHRDIKPANILLRSKSGTIDVNQPLPADVEPVLTDFGLVRLLDSSIQTSTGTVSGTPAYMSPEQARGDRVDRKTDIYSLGVVLYEMLAGSVPFDAESSFGVLMKHLNEPPPPITGINSDLQDVIDRALAKEPAHRFDSAGKFAEEFISVFNGQTVSADTEKVRKFLHPAEASALTTKETTPKPTKYLLPAAGLFTIAALAITALAVAGILVFRARAARRLPPNQPVGHVNFTDFNNVMDKTLVTVNGLPSPRKGTHYEVWYVSQDGSSRLDVGKVDLESSGGQLAFLSPDGANLFSQFDQVEVTVEADNDSSPNQASKEVVASSVFPPQALVEVRNLLVSFEGAPDGTALVQGLWVTTDDIDTSIYDMNQAFKNGDEATFRIKVEEIINQLAGNKKSDLYKDWNGDGEISDPAAGYGLLPNVDQGYIPQSINHAQMAAQAPDATGNIKQSSDNMIVCAKNIESWAHPMLDLTLQLQNMPFGPDMQSIITQIQSLSSNMLYGVDANNNGRIEPIPGEGGADTAYESAYLMADMPLLPGIHRIPPAELPSSP